jgi:DNA-nicking Smr family endonuclease
MRQGIMDEEERALFRHAMRGVRRLDAGNRHPAAPRKPRPRARFARADRHAVLQESLGVLSPLDPVQESGDALLFRRPDASEQIFRRLRSGQFRVEAEIDLHGLTAMHAETALREFLAECLHQGLHVVRVIHGKGLRSGNRGPVLKQVASAYLQRVGAVLAFASAREVDGGSGALLVLLGTKPQRR